MSNELTLNKCRDCGQTGHTSTSCKNGKVGILHLFGVRIDPTADQSGDDDFLQIVNGVGSSIRESKNTEISRKQDNEHSFSIDLEYLSDHEHRQDKKKGVPWTEDEHRSFLLGLEKLGKSNWRAISKNYVPSRTPTQVASHAQKYFIRMNATDEKRTRRASLFDISSNEFSTEPREYLGLTVTLPMAINYGVEGYNRFSNVMGYGNNHIPMMNRLHQENVYPRNRRTKPFDALVSQPLSITDGEKLVTQEPELERTKK